jgi:hypothetical protein
MRNQSLQWTTPPQWISHWELCVQAMYMVNQARSTPGMRDSSIPAFIMRLPYQILLTSSREVWSLRRDSLIFQMLGDALHSLLRQRSKFSQSGYPDLLTSLGLRRGDSQFRNQRQVIRCHARRA